MSRRSSLSVLAVLAAGGALIAGCSSSSSSSSSTPTAATSAAGSTGASSSGTPSMADCVIISKVSSNVLSTLSPLQNEPASKGEVALKAYIATLSADEAKLTSTRGKAALGAFVSALEKASTETASTAAGSLTTAIGNLADACA